MIHLGVHLDGLGLQLALRLVRFCEHLIDVHASLTMRYGARHGEGGASRPS